MRKTLLTLFAVSVLALLAPGSTWGQQAGYSVSTVAALPATCDKPGQLFIVIDGTSSSDCSAGGGSTIHACYCNATGNGFDPQPGGSPDPDSVGTPELNDGADTPLVSQIVAVDSGNANLVEYLVIGLGFTNDGDSFLFDYAQTVGGNPALSADECILVATASGGGFLCEGSAADGNEMYFLLPDLNEADTTHVIVTESATQTLTGKTLTTPVIGDFTSAAHDHADAAGGGDVALGAGSTATTAAKGTDSTAIATTAYTQAEIRLDKHWDSFDLFVDGTKCKTPVVKQINSGPRMGTIDCDDDAASELGGHVRLDTYKGGTIVFTLEAISVNAAPSLVLDFDFAAMCRGDSDTVDATWSSPSNAAITFTTQFDIEHGATAAITPNGTCQVGDTLYWRARMDDTATTAVVADVEIVGVTAREQ
jgi:hypothetical protein